MPKKLSSTDSYQQAVLEYINRLDPTGEIVTIDVAAKEIKFNTKIECHQAPKYEPEGYVRAYLVVRLIKELGYPIDCIELENDLNVQVGRTKKHKGVDRGRSDITVFKRSKSGESLFLGIECKTPSGYEAGKKDLSGQLWGIPKAESIQTRVKRNVRYLVYYTIEHIGSEINDKAIIVDFQQFQTYSEWIAAKSPFSNVIPAQYGDSPKSVYANVVTEDQKTGWKPLNKKYTPSDFDKLRTRLHDSLWAGSSTGDNSIFYQLTKIFLIKIWDELNTDPDKPYKIQIRSTSNGDETADELYDRLKICYESACRDLLNYDNEKLMTFPFLVEGFTKQKLFVAIRELQGLSLTENESRNFDILGSFFEGIMTNQEFVKQSTGSFFTHPYIVRFILAMVGTESLALEFIKATKPRLPYLIDPSNGSGTFLIEAMKYITSRVRSAYPSLKLNSTQSIFYKRAFEQEDKPNVWAEDFLYGFEPRADLGLAAKVNMILHGDGNMNIFIEDGLHVFRKSDGSFVYDRKRLGKDAGRLIYVSKPENYEVIQVNEQFDIVVSNPPFSLETEALDSTATHKESYLYSQASNSENLFIERYYQLLAPNGKLGVVLPESVFDTSDNKYIRQFLYRYFRIDAIVSLPQESFEPFTSTKVSLLFATKKTNQEVSRYAGAWEKAAQKYAQLRKSLAVQAVLENNKLLNSSKGLLAMCSEFDIALDLSQSILDETVFTEKLANRLAALVDEMPVSNKREQDAKKERLQRLSNIDAFVKSRVFDSLPGDTIGELKEFLRNYIPDTFETAREICERAFDEIVEIAQLDYPDYGDKQSYTNTWWCFSEVSSQPEFDQPIFFAEVQNIGYKRTKREEKVRPNDLYTAGVDGFPVADVENPKTVFDFYTVWKNEHAR